MDTFIVKESSNPTVIIPHYETPIARFLAAGTIVHVETNKTSLAISAAVDRSPGGFAKPAIKFNLKW